MIKNKTFKSSKTLNLNSRARISYLTGEYPRATDTFIQREVFALRELGVDVFTCSIRRTAEVHNTGYEQRSEREKTFYVMDAAVSPLKLIISHFSVFCRSPFRWMSALRLCWNMRPPGMKAFVWQIFYFLEAGVLAHHLHNNQIEHLHCHSADSSGSVAAICNEMSGIPFSFTIHGPGIFFEPNWWRIDEKVARARFVACISFFCRSQVMLFSDKKHWSKLHVIHCGVFPEQYRSGSASERKKNVIFVGRLDPVKGVTILLNAFSKASEAHPDSKLIIVGDGPARRDLEMQARELGISDLTTFTGYRSQAEVAELLQQSAVLALPSFAEGVPVVLMEAMASRVPVIASQVGGVAELVQDGETGFLVPPGDQTSLTLKLSSILSDEVLRDRMGIIGQKKVEAQFDVRLEAEKLLRLLRDGY